MERSCYLLAVVFLLSGCWTSTGMHTKQIDKYDWDLERTKIDLCVFRDPRVPMKRVQQCNAYIAEELERYNIQLNVVRTWEKKRENFLIGGLPFNLADGVYDEIRGTQLVKPCDRYLWYLGRHAGDVAWDFGTTAMGVGGKLVGGVEDRATTMGLVFIQHSGPMSLLSSTLSNGKVNACSLAWHEFEHLMGCGHGLTKNQCYESIWRMKTHSTEEFVPAFILVQSKKRRSMCWSREECDRLVIPDNDYDHRWYREEWPTE